MKSTERKKDPNAVALGRKSAKARKGITDYKQMGKNSWNNLTKEQQKARIDRLHKARKAKKLSTDLLG